MASITCSNCKKDIEDQYSFCPFCGKPPGEKPPVDDDEIDNICREMITIDATEEQQKKAEDGFWDKIKKQGARIPFMRDALALYYMMTDMSLSLHRKSAAVFAIIYFITPLDLIPDFIPLSGLLDDAGVIMWVMKYYRETMQPYLAKADEWLKEHRDET